MEVVKIGTIKLKDGHGRSTMFLSIPSVFQQVGFQFDTLMIVKRHKENNSFDLGVVVPQEEINRRMDEVSKKLQVTEVKDAKVKVDFSVKAPSKTVETIIEGSAGGSEPLPGGK